MNPSLSPRILLEIQTLSMHQDDQGAQDDQHDQGNQLAHDACAGNPGADLCNQLQYRFEFTGNTEFNIYL